MKPKISKQEVEQQIKETFSNKPTPKQIKKIKRLAMNKKISIKPYRKKFCKKCLTLFTPNNSEIRIKKPHKIIKCKQCNNISRYKL
jgi:RNase P subunit RPR2